MKLNLSVDEVLTTTRSVRLRLDHTKPVSRAIIDECLELAFQAPNGGNRNIWHWLVVDDPVMVGKVAAIYHASMDEITRGVAEYKPAPAHVPREDLIGPSVLHLLENFHRMPALLIPMMTPRTEGGDCFAQAGVWGSVVQAVWSFFLALRERGLGSAWTTVHLRKEKEAADLLGIPYDKYMQVGLFPIAYTAGTDFKKAYRKPLSEVRSFNRFGQK